MVSTSVAVVSSPSLSTEAPSTSLQAVAEKGEREAALLQASAEAMLAIAKEPGTNGLGNFRFCASFCVRPGVPFFPAAYHDQVREWSGVWGKVNEEFWIERREG